MDLRAVRSVRKSLKKSVGIDVDGAVLLDMVGLSGVEVARGGIDWVVEERQVRWVV